MLNPAKINIIPAPEERAISSDKASNPGSIAPTIVPASNNGRSNNEEKPISISIPLADTNEQKEEPKRIEIIEMPVQLAHPQRLFDYQYTDGDIIDMMLAAEIAEYIRNNGLLRVILRRIKEGVYMFGRTKINVILTNDKITVRVGGGYMCVEEFIRTYEPMELAKMAGKQVTRNKYKT